MDARFVFGECLEASQRCSDDFKMDAFKSENGSEIGTSSSSVTDEFADASRPKNRIRLYCSGVFLGTFLTLVLAVSARRVSLGGVDALNHREMRRKARRERPLFSAIFCGVEREERY